MIEEYDNHYYKDWSLKNVSCELIKGFKRIGLENEQTLPEVLCECYNAYIEQNEEYDDR